MFALSLRRVLGALLLATGTPVCLSAQGARDSLRARDAARDSIRALPTMTVTPTARTVGDGVAPAIGAQSTGLSREELRRVPQPLDDLFRGMGRLPGVATSDQGARIALRGAAPDETLILLDGMRLRDPFHLKDFDGSFSVLDPEYLAQVTLLRGGVPAAYGDQLGGVLLFTPRDGGPERVGGARRATTVGAGLTGVRATHRGASRDGRTAWLASARRAWLDVVLSAAGATEGTNTVVRPRFDDAYLRLVMTPQRSTTAVTRVAGNLLLARDALTFRADGDPSLTSDYRSGYGWVTTTRITSHRTTVLTTGFTQLHNARSGTGAGSMRTTSLADDRQLKAWSARLDQDWRLSSRVALRSGFDLLLEQARAATWRRTGVGAVPSTDASGTRAAGWLSARVPMGPAVWTDVGFRAERWSHLGASVVTPRVAMAWSLAPTTTVQFAAGGLAQGMGVGDRALADADSNWYPPVRAHGASASIEHGLPAGMSLSVGAYHREETGDRARFVNVTGGLTPVGELEGDRQRMALRGGRVRGAELLLRRVGNAVFWSMGYTTARATDVSAAGAWLPRPWDLRHSVTSDLSWSPGRGWQIAAGTLWHSGWPFSIGQVQLLAPTRAVTVWPQWLDGRTPSYLRLDARISRSWRTGAREWRVFLDSFNSLNRANQRGEFTRLQRTGGTWYLTRHPITLAPFVPTAGVVVTF